MSNSIGIPYAPTEVTSAGVIRTCPECGKRIMESPDLFDNEGEYVTKDVEDAPLVGYALHYERVHRTTWPEPMAKPEAKLFADEMADLIVQPVRGTRVTISTWMDRPGVSIELRLQSADDGRRIIVHKWDDEVTCSVRYIFGSFWRPRRGREGVEYGRVDNVDFATFNAAIVANDLVRAREAAAS